MNNLFLIYTGTVDGQPCDFKPGFQWRLKLTYFNNIFKNSVTDYGINVDTKHKENGQTG